MKNAYERIVRPLLFAIDPEMAHRLTLGTLSAASRIDLALRALTVFRPPLKPKKLFRLDFPNPIGLAAGLDKNGVRSRPGEHLGSVSSKSARSRRNHNLAIQNRGFFASLNSKR